MLAAAGSDPAGFVGDLDRVILDEGQRAPDLLRAIKLSVDGDRRSGRFLLTGSAKVLTLPQASESLAGRLEIVTLLPLSRAEVLGTKPAFLRMAFTGRLHKSSEVMLRNNLVRTVLLGGYPELRMRTAPWLGLK